jgi:hypothetical protein
MDIFKTLLFTIIIATTGCAHTLLEGELEGISDFKSLVGNGMLEVRGTTIETVQAKAWITVNDNEVILDKESCESFMLNSRDELLVKIAHCGEKQEYIMCAGNVSECIIDFETEKSGSSLSLVNDSHGDETRFLVEFHPNKITYRIQGEDCLIGYPHGCIIDGFKWLDEKVYTYEYK